MLGGEDGPKRDVVALNAAAGLVVADLAADMAEGFEMATSSIDSGEAMSALTAWQEFSQKLSQQ